MLQKSSLSSLASRLTARGVGADFAACSDVALPLQSQLLDCLVPESSRNISC